MHASEIRRLLEGKRIKGDLKREAQSAKTAHQDSFENERTQLKQQAKANAVEQYKQNQGLV